MSGADKVKQKLEEGTGTNKNQDKYKEEMDAQSSRVRSTRYPAAHKGKQKLEGEDVLPSPNRLAPSAVHNEKQELEGEGEGADNNKQGEGVLSSRDRLIPPAADKFKQNLEEGQPADPYGLGQDVLYFRDSIVPPDACKGKQKLEQGSGEGDKLAPNRLTLVWVETCPDIWFPGRVLDEETAKARSTYIPTRKTPYEVPVRLYGGYVHVCIDPKMSRSKLNKIYKGHEEDFRDIFEKALRRELNYVYYDLTTEESHLTYFYNDHHMRQISELMAQYSEYMANNFDSRVIQADPPEAEADSHEAEADSHEADPPEAEADPHEADPSEAEADPPEAEADPREADPPEADPTERVHLMLPEAEADRHEAEPPASEAHPLADPLQSVWLKFKVFLTGWPRVFATLGMWVLVVVLAAHFGSKYF